MKFILLFIPGFIITSIVVFSLSNFTYPFSDDPSNHMPELRKIPEVETFFDIYGSSVSKPFATDEGLDKYRIVFTAQTQNTASQLEIYYFAWMPFSTIYKCVNLNSEMIFMGSDIRNTFDQCATSNI